jgi:hypothetical protein
MMMVVMLIMMMVIMLVMMMMKYNLDSFYCRIYLLFSLNQRQQGCPSIAWIADIKFSPETGRYLAVGSHDSNLYMYDDSDDDDDDDT